MSEPKPVRRIVTVDDARGASHAVVDGPSPDVRTDPARPGWIQLSGLGPVRVAGELPAGEVDVMVRPERLRLRRPDEGDGMDNLIDLIVDDTINYGDSVLVIGKTRGLPLRARLSSKDGAALEPGAALPLAWAPADAHVLARR